MAIMNQAFVDGAHAVARAVEHQVRQAVTSTVASALSTPTDGFSSSFTPSPSASSVLPQTLTTTTTDPSQTTMSNNGGNSVNNQNNSGTSSPLLFFVALGFGVVFTNLWIIVGVKYCFRYNARNRALRAVDENGEPINLENMPTRPHRRRREKKLMTMDEVNEKFPMMKYKSWVATRAEEGLPTAGGVTVPPSRAGSVRSVQGIIPELASKERESTEDRPRTSPAANAATDKDAEATKADGTSKPADETNDSTQATTETKDAPSTEYREGGNASDDDDDDEHINAALPPECLAAPGDSCAICIDTLEDDDDVRGLTCGHAFHAVCLDPWLTNRRACCPLCKADYYTPKPRPPPTEGDPTSPTSPNGADPSRNGGRMNLPRAPQNTLTSWTMRGSRSQGNRNGSSRNRDDDAQRSQRQRERRREQSQPEALPQTEQTQEREGALARFRNQLPTFRMNRLMRSNRDAPQQNETTEVAVASGANGTAPTPSQLEAGVAASTSTTQRFA